jgi:hypothetical protein
VTEGEQVLPGTNADCSLTGFSRRTEQTRPGARASNSSRIATTCRRILPDGTASLHTTGDFDRENWSYTVPSGQIDSIHQNACARPRASAKMAKPMSRSLSRQQFIRLSPPGLLAIHATLQSTRGALARSDIDAVVIGEAREWEGVEYAQDQIAANNKKGLIILGQVMSGEAGMRECAEWLKTFVTEVPAGEPYRMPGGRK